jgi:hypothetical protein
MIDCIQGKDLQLLDTLTTGIERLEKTKNKKIDVIEKCGFQELSF